MTNNPLINMKKETIEPEKPDLRYADISAKRINYTNIRSDLKEVPSFEDILIEGNEQRKLAYDINKNLQGFLNHFSKSKTLMQQNHNNNVMSENFRNIPPNLKFTFYANGPISTKSSEIPRINRNSIRHRVHKPLNQKNITIVNDLNINIRSKSPLPYQSTNLYSNLNLNSNSNQNSILLKYENLNQDKTQIYTSNIKSKNEINQKPKNLIGLHKNLQTKTNQNNNLYDTTVKPGKFLLDLNNSKFKEVSRSKDTFIIPKLILFDAIENDKDESNPNIKKNQEHETEKDTEKESIKSGNILNSKSLIFPKPNLKFMNERRKENFQGLKLMNRRRLSMAENNIIFPLNSRLISYPVHNIDTFANDLCLNKNKHQYLQNLQNIYGLNKEKNEQSQKEVSITVESNKKNPQIHLNAEKYHNLLDKRVYRKNLKPSAIIHQSINRKKNLTEINNPLNTFQRYNLNLRLSNNYSSPLSEMSDLNTNKNLQISHNYNDFKTQGKIIRQANLRKLEKEEKSERMLNIPKFNNLNDKKSIPDDKDKLTNYNKLVTPLRRTNSINYNSNHNLTQPFLLKPTIINQTMVKKSFRFEEEEEEEDKKENHKMNSEIISQAISPLLSHENPTMRKKVQEISPKNNVIKIERIIDRSHRSSQISPLKIELNNEKPIYYKKRLENNNNFDNQNKNQNVKNLTLQKIPSNNNRSSMSIPSETHEIIPDQTIHVNFCLVFFRSSIKNPITFSDSFPISKAKEFVLNRYERKKIVKKLFLINNLSKNLEFNNRVLIDVSEFENIIFQLKFDTFRTKGLMNIYRHLYVFVTIALWILNCLQFFSMVIITAFILRK